MQRKVYFDLETTGFGNGVEPVQIGKLLLSHQIRKISVLKIIIMIMHIIFILIQYYRSRLSTARIRGIYCTYLHYRRKSI